MKIKNILTAAACISLCFAALTGCTVQKQDENMEQQNKNAETSKDFSYEIEKENEVSVADEAEPAELTYLRAKIKENHSAVGVAYCGFVSNIESIHDYNYASDFSTNSLFRVYPFFYIYPVSINVGVEMFAVVPASTQSHITVYKVVLSDNGEFVVDRDTVLYEDASGKPFVFLCNDHEAYSNVLIIVQDGDETVEVSPRISIEDDRGLVLGDGCYDFTVKDIRDYRSEAREYLTENIDEIRDGMENGMILRWDDEISLYGHYALQYALGKYDEDGTFHVVREYLIDEYYTMAFYAPAWDEDTTGWRVVGKGFEYSIFKFHQAKD